ncbi:hypothetical protein [uncultured Rhodoblastus sp.]|uniref:hypothetical protein n=1 Tax=uncultured Rhodoblastus sp. TaxID=543037 RepID=UPI0025E03A2B|nr:hypothetical protein [uncultured Rhodoblastus sp.]
MVDPENRNPDFFPAAAPPKPEPQRSAPQLPPQFFRPADKKPENPPPVAAPRVSAPVVAPPVVAPPVAAAPSPAPPAAAAAPPFEDDAPVAPGRLGLPAQTQALLGRVADLLRRADTPTPFAIGLLAKAGAGKTSALRWLVESLKGTPAATLRAADLADEPETAVASALYRALTPFYPALVEEAAREGAHLGADPGAHARAAQEKLDVLRRKLMLERQTLAQTEARRAGLADTLLYDMPGSRVDSLARRMRGGFAPRLRRFGFSGDSLAAFKDLTRDLAEIGGIPARLLACARAVYAFPGQLRLLVYAALCVALNWGADWLYANRTFWVGAISEAGAQGAQAGEYLRAHLDWLPRAGDALLLLAVALVALNLWRALRFMLPLFQAASLLDDEVESRRHELEQLLAHHARNVDLLGAETAAVAQQAAEAERRAAGASRHPPLFLETDAAAQKRRAALGFLHGLSGLIAPAAAGKRFETPARLIVAVDGFEAAPNPAALFERLHDLLARPGLVAVYALDPDIFGGSGRDGLHRRLQLALRLDAGQASEWAVPLAPLDAPLSAEETRLLETMAPVAGASPRMQKRLRNLFRFLRPAPDAPMGLKPALALLLAADLGASPDDRRCLIDALASEGIGFAPKNSRLLQQVLASTGPIDRDTARRAAALARHVTTD